MNIFLEKNIVDENLPTISIENENASIYAYDNHIVILKDNKLTIYNASGKEETTINVQVNNQYLVRVENTCFWLIKGAKMFI